jgi:hypothetical protein
MKLRELVGCAASPPQLIGFLPFSARQILVLVGNAEYVKLFAKDRLRWKPLKVTLGSALVRVPLMPADGNL